MQTRRTIYIIAILSIIVGLVGVVVVLRYLDHHRAIETPRHAYMVDNVRDMRLVVQGRAIGATTQQITQIKAVMAAATLTRLRVEKGAVLNIAPSCYLEVLYNNGTSLRVVFDGDKWVYHDSSISDYVVIDHPQVHNIPAMLAGEQGGMLILPCQ